MKRFRPDEFAAALERLRERHSADLLRLLNRHDGRTCELCGFAVAAGELHVSGLPHPVLELRVCRHIHRGLGDTVKITGEIAISVENQMPWD